MRLINRLKNRDKDSRNLKYRLTAMGMMLVMLCLMFSVPVSAEESEEIAGMTLL